MVNRTELAHKVEKALRQSDVLNKTITLAQQEQQDGFKFSIQVEKLAKFEIVHIDDLNVTIEVAYPLDVFIYLLKNNYVLNNNQLSFKTLSDEDIRGFGTSRISATLHYKRAHTQAMVYTFQGVNETLVDPYEMQQARVNEAQTQVLRGTVADVEDWFIRTASIIANDGINDPFVLKSIINYDTHQLEIE